MVVVVIGGGLIGSAAAKYLAQSSVDVTVLAPPEPDPTRYANHPGPFASHYDEGRITRITDGSDYWADVAQRSIDQYRRIEQESGIGFYTERPLVYFTTADDEVEAMASAAASRGADTSVVDADWVAANTALHRPSGYQAATAVYEASPAGYINPRRMVEAQLAVAAMAGAKVVPAAAVGLDEDAGGVTVTVADGSTVRAEQVLVATGAYGLSDLVGDSAGGMPTPAAEPRLRTVALLEVGPGPDLPTLIMSGLNTHGLAGIYWVPPVRYPDGGTYLKIGGEAITPDGEEAPVVTTESGSGRVRQLVADWFAAGGSLAEAQALATVAGEILADRTVRLVNHKPCVVAFTADDRPVVGRLSDRVVTAFAGCGAAAKSADAIGRDVVEQHLA